MSKYCNYCGRSNDDNSEFCNGCGKSLPKTILNNEKKSNLGNKILIFGITIIIGLLIGFYFSKVYVSSSNNSNIQEPTQSQQINEKGIHYTNYNQEQCPQTTTPTQTCDYSSYETQINSLRQDLIDEQQENSQKQNEINSLNNELEKINEKYLELNSLYFDTKNDLIITKNQLDKTKEELNITLPYYERVRSGLDIKELYKMLDDYDKYAQPLVLEYLNLEQPTKPANDKELWDRAKKIYNWISYRYDYCGDRGLRFGSSYFQFQFFSPDELLSVDNYWCGDCDDYATLFAGLMFASGVDEDDIYVVCGKVGEGGHCWNWLNVNEKLYRIDTICSHSKYLEEVLGIPLWWKDEKQSYPFPDDYGVVDCFETYEPQMFMNPSNFTLIDNND